MSQSSPIAIVTESAERVYVDETRDTVQSPPLVASAERATVEASPIALPTDTTSSAPAVTEAASESHDDRVAAQRGLPPIRIPSLSTAFVPLRALTSRRVVLGALVVAALSLAVAAAAVIWAFGVARAPGTL